jgi:hypothetical protein
VLFDTKTEGFRTWIFCETIVIDMPLAAYLP